MSLTLTDLSPEDQQMLFELADKSKDVTLREAVQSYLERSAASSESNEAPDSEPKPDPGDLNQTGEDDGLDTACIQWCAEQLQRQPPPSLEEVRQELSTIKGSLSAEIIAERDEF